MLRTHGIGLFRALGCSDPKPWLGLLTIAVLSGGATACGGAGHNGSGVSHASSIAAAPHARSVPLALDNDHDFDSTGRTHYDPDDYKILAYGREAAPAERRAVTTLVKRYYAAAAAADGVKACALMSSALAEGIIGIYGPQRDSSAPHEETCAAVASHLFKQRRRQIEIDKTTLAITGVRLGQSLGYALLRFRALPDRHLLLYRESGTWKIDAALDDRRV